MCEILKSYIYPLLSLQTFHIEAHISGLSIDPQQYPTFFKDIFLPINVSDEVVSIIMKVEYTILSKPTYLT